MEANHFSGHGIAKENDGSDCFPPRRICHFGDQKDRKGTETETQQQITISHFMEVEPERIFVCLYFIRVAEIQNFPWERKYENTFEEDEDDQKEVESQYRG